MNLNVEIPDDLAQRLSAGGGDLSRRALEGFAVEYKTGRVTKAELRRLLGFDTRYDTRSTICAEKSLRFSGWESDPCAASLLLTPAPSTTSC